MADRNYRRGGRDRPDHDRGYSRQSEQLDPTDYRWRDEERGLGQMGEVWREEDYDAASPSYTRDRNASRDWGRDPSYPRRNEGSGASAGTYGATRYGARGVHGFDSFTGGDFGGSDFSNPRFTNERAYPGAYGDDTRLGAHHGAWRGEYGASPGREYRDYRGAWDRSDAHERGWFDRAADSVASFFGDEDAARRRERDYRGHGPSGYTRSDERILEDACDALTDDWAVDARKVSVTVSEGDVTLDGTVPSRDQKRRAEDCVDDLSGVRNVQNNLRVEGSTAWDRNNSGEIEASGSNPTSGSI